MGKLSTFLVLVCLSAAGSTGNAQTGKTAPADGGRVTVRVDGQQKELYSQQSYALVIGNSVYDKWNALPGVEEDIAAVTKALESQGFVVDIARNLKSKSLRDKVEAFIQNWGYDKDRRIVIYFAGHGDTQRALDGRKQGYIIPTDAPRFSQNPKEFRQLAISMNIVEAWAKTIQSMHALFVFDSCFAGTLVTRSDISFPPYIHSKLLQPSRQFITSGDENQVVADNSLFRKLFVRGLEGEADQSKDGYVLASELADFIKENVSNHTGNKQTPLYGTVWDGELDRGDMVFSVPIEVRLANEKSVKEAWGGTVKNDKGSLERFVRHFSGSPQAMEAEALLLDLEKSAKTFRSDSSNVATVEGPRPLEKLSIAFQAATYDGKGAMAKSNKMTPGLREDLGRGITIDLVQIPTGKFNMGSTADNEKPIREVSVDEFYMSATEVTQAQWRTIARTKRVNIDLEQNPSTNLGDGMPVDSISWEQAKEFCARLSRETGRRYDLPSEAEWEYAARGGSAFGRPFGDMLSSEVANYDALPRPEASAGYSLPGTKRDGPIDAGSLKIANGYGLYDVLGNVAEWCLDNWQFDYKGAPANASSRENGSRKRVVRGGSFNTLPSELTVTRRKPQAQDESFMSTGFRIVLHLATQK
jgi:formylglycine-generating enzyme required for sulfatase activity